MPLLTITTSAPAPSPERVRALLASASALLARELGKPEAYVMTCLNPASSMTFAGDASPCCYAELKNVGEFRAETTRRLSSELCRLLGSAFSVDPARIYIEFSGVPGHLWGFDGDTFA